MKINQLDLKCDYADAYVLVNGAITVTSQNNIIRDKKNADH